MMATENCMTLLWSGSADPVAMCRKKYASGLLDAETTLCVVAMYSVMTGRGAGVLRGDLLVIR